MKYIASCLTILLLLFSGCAPSASKTRLVRIGLTHSENHSFTLALKQFGRLLEKRSEGRFKVVIYPSSQVGSEKEMQEMLSIGSLDASITGIINQYEPLFALLEMPYLYRDREHVLSVNTSELMNELATPLYPLGIHLFGFYENGFRNITNSVRPINNPEDLAGLLIRTPENLAQIETMKALGAIPTPLSFSELYTALIQGVVDGQENPLQNIWFGRLHEAQKYVAMTRHIYNSVYIVMSTRLWYSLSPEEQALFNECIIESSIWQMEYVQRQESEIAQKMKEYGVAFTYPDQAEFEKKTEPAYEAIYDRLGPQAREIVKTIKEM